MDNKKSSYFIKSVFKKKKRKGRGDFLHSFLFFNLNIHSATKILLHV